MSVDLSSDIKLNITCVQQFFANSRQIFLHMSYGREVIGQLVRQFFVFLQ